MLGADTARGASARHPSAVAGISPIPVAGIFVGPPARGPPPSRPFPVGDPASAPPAAGTGAVALLQASATKVAIMSGYRMRPPESLQMADRDRVPDRTSPLPDKHRRRWQRPPSDAVGRPKPERR